MIETNSQYSRGTIFIVNVVRWLAFLPTAILAAIIAQAISNILNTYAMNYYMWLIGSESLLGKLAMLWILVFGNIIFGGVLVYVSSWVAPVHKRIVAIVLAGFFLVVTGSGMTLALLSNIFSYKDIFAMLAGCFGGIVMAISIYTEEIPLEHRGEYIK